MTTTTKQTNPSLPLSTLFKDISDTPIPDHAAGTLIRGLSCDSRGVQEGYLFAALKGANTDGSQFITQAVDAGAVALLGDADEKQKAPKGVCYLAHPNPRLAFSQLAARFYPDQPPMIAAITGTNGKTSTAHFCRELWHHMDKRSASIGTIGITDSDGKFEYDRSNFLTTPDPVKLHDILNSLAGKNIECLAMEASSHGLDQYRLDGVRVNIGVFTNFTRDHLDYHGTFENYLNAKLRLFDAVMQPAGTAIINADIPQYQTIVDVCEKRRHRVMSLGKKGIEVRIIDVQATPGGQCLMFEAFGRPYEVEVPLVGLFQAYNVLSALTVAVASGADVDKVAQALEKVSSVPGRMERVSQADAKVQVFVDYAHTPDALEKALSVLKPHTSGQLWVVFGCGGDRDAGKRQPMGNIACQYADKVVVTDDNPRTEDAAAIRAQIMRACDDTAQQIADRKEAIAFATSQLQPGDALLIAGKGHEKYQLVGDQMLTFDDVLVAKAAL